MSRVLVVEDSKFQHKSILKILSKHEFETESAFNGEEGLEKALVGSYDIITSDILMPIRDGLSMIQALREKDVNTPVVILSSDIQDSIKEQASSLSVNAFINKPVKEDELILAIKSALG